MINYIDALKARRELGTIMDKAQYRNEYTIIKRANKPVAAIVSAELLEGIMRYGNQLRDIILDSAEQNNLDAEVALQLGTEAKKFSRK